MTYEYLCSGCGHHWEAEQSISSPPLKACPSCNEDTAKRQVSGGAGFILKGSGWYADLYSSKKPEKSEKSEKSETKESGGSAAKTEGTTSSTTESAKSSGSASSTGASTATSTSTTPTSTSKQGGASAS